MSRNDSVPLLSICIPTYNGADLLRVTLEALLPQVVATGGLVEVVVVDDVSPDNTADVIVAARKLGPFRFVRNQDNLGIINNEISAATAHAKGKYVWAWNQHCLIYPGALETVVDVLKKNHGLDLFYANFRCADFPDQWPLAAIGGYSGEFDYLGNELLFDKEVNRWHELIDGKSALCTQSYAHIVRRSIWVKFWKGKTSKEVFINAATTYPHTYLITATSFDQPAYYIGMPVLTIFNGAQTWGSSPTRCRVYTLGLPDLIRIFARMGLRDSQLLGAKQFNKYILKQVILNLIEEQPKNKTGLFAVLVYRSFRYPYLFGTIITGFMNPDTCLVCRWIGQFSHGLRISYQYVFFRCRPARWFWASIRSRPGGK